MSVKIKKTWTGSVPRTFIWNLLVIYNRLEQSPCYKYLHGCDEHCCPLAVSSCHCRVRGLAPPDVAGRERSVRPFVGRGDWT